MTKAPLGGEATGPNPTDRGKSGTKRHLLVDGYGLPIGLVVIGANRHDMTQVEAVLESMPPVPTREEPQHFCADKGYDYQSVRRVIALDGMTDHIKSRTEERLAACDPDWKSRRWVVERTHSWMNRFRPLVLGRNLSARYPRQESSWPWCRRSGRRSSASQGWRSLS